MRNFVELYHNTGGQADPRYKLKQFIDETKDLCNGFQLPHDLQTYINIAELGFKSLYSNQREKFERLLNERYIDFLMEIMSESEQFNKEYINEFFGSKVFDDLNRQSNSNQDL